MTSSRSSGKRRRNNKTGAGQKAKGERRPKPSVFRLLPFAAPLLLVAVVLSSPALSPAQDAGAQQFQQTFSVRGRTAGTLIILGHPSDAASIQKLADMAIAEANRVYDLLDASNPASEVAKLNATGGGGKQKVSWQVADAFKAAKKAAQWTKGAFDVIVVGGDHNSFSVDDKDNTVEFKKSGMEARFDQIIEGVLADYLITLINQANMQNAMVRVGNVFRGIGQSLHGPWKIQVQEDSSAYARHALNLTVSNTGIATISATDFRSKPLIDYRSKNAVNPIGKGATIVMSDAALAQGIAYGVFVAGPEEGLNILSKCGGRGLIVDAQGKFLRTPGL